MQAYGEAFARVYNRKWNDFTRSVAPKVEELFASHNPEGRLPKTLLDVCCGTGQLAAYFLARGYRVHGIDLSPHMLAYAVANNAVDVDAGRAVFTQADAASFSLDESFSFATCLYDAMNHLPSMAAISSCLRCVHDCLVPGGLFLFDINTREVLKRWNQVSVQEDDETFILNRGLFDGSMDRAYANITGFIKEEDGRYRRFHEVAYNIVIDEAALDESMHAAGFKNVHRAFPEDLAIPAAQPDPGRRAFFVCRKPA